jgi:hypothetical protein
MHTHEITKTALAALTAPAYGRFVAAQLGAVHGCAAPKNPPSKKARKQLAFLRTKCVKFQMAVWAGAGPVGGCLYGRYGAVHAWLSSGDF